MDRKKLSLLLLSSAMLGMWGCGEGDVFEATDDDELLVSKIEKMDDAEFLQTFIDDYCKGKKSCEEQFVKSSSSSEESSSSSEKSSSSKSKSSSSVKSSSSSAKSSSSVKSSSSSAKSSSSVSSSSKDAPKISGKCELIKPSEVHVGDAVIWRYLPDDNSVESAAFKWEVSNQIKEGLEDGELEGTGLPELTVTFSTIGKKIGPYLHFGDEGFDCDYVIVVEEGTEPVESSSSSAPKSSSSSKAKSSSSSAVEGHCAVTKSEVYVGDEVDWYVAGPDGEVLEGFYNWIDIGTGGEIVAGKQSDRNGSTRITVVYSQTGAKVTHVQFGNQMIDCDYNEGEDFLVVKAKEVSSSSSSEPEESSSSEEEIIVKSSSSKGEDPCPDGNCGVIDF